MKGILAFAQHLCEGVATEVTLPTNVNTDEVFTFNFGSDIEIHWAQGELIISHATIYLPTIDMLADAVFVVQQLKNFIECRKLPEDCLNILRRFSCTEYTPVFPVEDDAAHRLQKLGLVRVEAGYAYITEKGKALLNE